MLNITQAYQVALISSSHTSEEDARRFMIASNELDWVSQIDGGCIVHAGLQDDVWKEDLRRYGISEGAIANIQKVLDVGFDCVHFDCGAPIVEGLECWCW
ncbi:TPA: hypothetical protein SM709_002040 [Escherichia coli]|jgi:hypothetical protein|nr:hypothetical protein BE948_02220 [Escherichia coli]HBN3557382.1 hypothetical protein [Escherichia coli O25b:H4-ST131]ARA67093.1 hypothetical protein AM483_27025 [Escherichia coli]EHW4957028.1 hypothetical protein [Escherichia coli]EHX7933892.1 hypothetical protein [Escherichia coli]